MSLHNIRRYPHLLALFPLVLLLVVAVLNYLVDPYRIYTSKANTLYTQYPALHPNLRLHKAFQIRRQKPAIIVLGTSKAIQGVPLNHGYFTGKQMYNLGAPLASMREIYHLLLHAHANQNLEEIIFFADFLSFNALARNDGLAAGYVEARLDTQENNGNTLNDYLATTLSTDALLASSRVLWPDEQSGHRVLNGRGGRETEEILSRLSDGGHRSNSQRIESFFTNSVLLAAPHRSYSFEKDGDSSLFWFEQFVKVVQEASIKTSIIIGPSHTRYWELIYQAGIWKEFEAWKSQLVSINAQVAKTADKPLLPLWDFTIPNELTKEAFPALGDAKTTMQYYFEAVHFNQRTGGLVLDKISGTRHPSVPDTFGLLLNDKTLPSLTRQLREALELFRTQHSNTIEELRQALR